MHSSLAIRNGRSSSRAPSFRIRWNPPPRAENTHTHANTHANTHHAARHEPRPLIYSLEGIITHADPIERIIATPQHGSNATTRTSTITHPGTPSVAVPPALPVLATAADLPARFSGTLVIDTGTPGTPGVHGSHAPSRYAYLSIAARIRRPDGVATLAVSSQNLIRRLTIASGGAVVLVDPASTSDLAGDGSQLGFSLISGAGQFRVEHPPIASDPNLQDQVPASPLVVEGVITDAVASPAPGWSAATG